MKTSIIALSMLFSSQIFAKTTLEFKLMAEVLPNNINRGKMIQLSSLNTKLNAKDLPGFADVGVFGKNDGPYALKIGKNIEAAEVALKLKLDAPMFEYLGGYMHEFPTICYRGEASEVMGVIEGLFDSLFHADQGFLGIKYGKKKIITYPTQNFEVGELRQSYFDHGNKAEIKMWDKYDTKSDAVLIISDLGPQGDGTQMYATLINKCN